MAKFIIVEQCNRSRLFLESFSFYRITKAQALTLHDVGYHCERSLRKKRSEARAFLKKDAQALVKRIVATEQDAKLSIERE